jgi:hypothetical protein
MEKLATNGGCEMKDRVRSQVYTVKLPEPLADDFDRWRATEGFSANRGLKELIAEALQQREAQRECATT